MKRLFLQLCGEEWGWGSRQGEQPGGRYTTQASRETLMKEPPRGGFRGGTPSLKVS